MFKIDAVVFIVGLLHLFHLSSSQPPPPPPNLSNSFSTKVRSAKYYKVCMLIQKFTEFFQQIRQLNGGAVVKGMQMSRGEQFLGLFKIF